MRVKIASLVSAGLLIGAFQNCAPASFRMYTDDKAAAAGAPDVAQTPPADPGLPGAVARDVEVIKKACEGAMQTKTLKVHFANPVDPKDSRKTCRFGIGDNSTMAAERMMARVEQSYKFDIPTGTKLCGLKMKLPNQKFKFDDMFFLSLNEIVLASSSSIDKYSAPVDGLIPYEWLKIRGQSFRNDTNYQYCLGAKENLSTCAWPKTEVSGMIKMDFAPSLFHRIAARDLSRTTHELKMTTTGDDNPEIDCQHDPLSFDLEVSYAN